MRVIVTNSYDETCAVIAGMIRDLINKKPNAKLGLATGGTPVPIYQKLIEMNRAGQVDFSQVHTVNLDEYCGIPGTHEQSYRCLLYTSNHLSHCGKSGVLPGMRQFRQRTSQRTGVQHQDVYKRQAMGSSSNRGASTNSERVVCRPAFSSLSGTSLPDTMPT